MHLDDRFANGKAEAKTLAPGAALLEGVENLLEIVGLDSDAGVADFNMESLRPGIRRAHGNGAVTGRKFGGICENVPKDLLKS